MFEWTTAKPTQEGWYWVRKGDRTGWKNRITKVSRNNRGELCVTDLLVQNLPIEELDYGYQWAGPIPEPKEAGK